MFLTVCYFDLVDFFVFRTNPHVRKSQCPVTPESGSGSSRKSWCLKLDDVMTTCGSCNTANMTTPSILDSFHFWFSPFHQRSAQPRRCKFVCQSSPKWKSTPKHNTLPSTSKFTVHGDFIEMHWFWVVILPMSELMLTVHYAGRQHILYLKTTKKWAFIGAEVPFSSYS